MTQTIAHGDQVTISSDVLLEMVETVVERAMNRKEHYLTVKQVCSKLDISSTTQSKWRKEGKMPEMVEVNGFLRYRDSDIEKMIQRQNPHLLGLRETQVMADARRIAASI